VILSISSVELCLNDSNGIFCQISTGKLIRSTLPLFRLLHLNNRHRHFFSKFSTVITTPCFGSFFTYLIFYSPDQTANCIGTNLSKPPNLSRNIFHSSVNHWRGMFESPTPISVNAAKSNRSGL
jgi:hypothetical protein